MFPLNSISYETKIKIFLVNREAEIKYPLKRKEKNPKFLVYRKVRQFDLNQYYFECMLL